MSRKRKINEVEEDSDWNCSDDDMEFDHRDDRRTSCKSSHDFPELDSCDSKTKKEFKRICSEIYNTEPNIITVLNTEMLTDDKVELFQLFEAYANSSDDISLERLEIRKKFITKQKEAINRFNKHNQFSQQKHAQFLDDITQIEGNINDNDIKYDILDLQTVISNKKAIYTRYTKMRNLSLGDDELPKLHNWLKWSLNLPYDRVNHVNFTKKSLTKFLQNLSHEMDNELYGMKNVKEQLLVFLNSRLLNPNMKKCSLGLIGPPGVGKTAIIQLISRVLQYPLQQIKMGGVRSPEYLCGHQYTYIGSEPGEIVKCLTRMKLDTDDKPVKNGILFFDEYDKVSNNTDICSALLHITDSTQNHCFRDNFLSDLSIDLSHLWFVYSMNNIPTDDALSDRIHYVKIDGYTQDDKFYITRDYLLKKIHVHLGWVKNSLKFSDDAIRFLIQKVSPENIKGVRSLENAVLSIATKINFLIHHQNNRGKLPGFSISFDIGEKIKFPYLLGKNKLKIFID